MNKMSFIQGSLILVLGVLTSCQTTEKLVDDTPPSETTSAQELIHKLESDSAAYSKGSPFVERAFKPFLNGAWIGNAISYGCYREGQAPGVKGPSEAEILEDLNLLSPYWNLIRVYGSDDDSERVLKVIHDHNLPIRVMLGIWLENETTRPERKPENLEQVARGIDLANRFPDEVIAINVGNESQVDWSWHRMEMENLIQYIRAVRNHTQQPVTTADDYNFWNKDHSKRVAAEIDFIGLHAYPLWNGKTLDVGMAWIDTVFKAAQIMHDGKTIALTETGWATVYQPKNNGPGQEGALVKGDVSINAQETFLLQLNSWIDSTHTTTFLFEAFDEPWKGGGLESDPDVMEKHWGVFSENRQPKESFQKYLLQVE